eukprot:897831-Karenia_brevis.AAC.1
MAAGALEVQLGISQVRQVPQLTMAQATGQNTCIPTHNVNRGRAGIRIFIVNITNSSKKVIHWITTKKYRKQFYTSLLAKHFCVMFSPATDTIT